MIDVKRNRCYVYAPKPTDITDYLRQVSIIRTSVAKKRGERSFIGLLLFGPFGAFMGLTSSMRQRFKILLKLDGSEDVYVLYSSSKKVVHFLLSRGLPEVKHDQT